MANLIKASLNRKVNEENLNCYSVNEIEDMMITLVEEFFPIQFEENCSERYFRNMFVALKLRKEFLNYAKSFKGMDGKKVCIFFIQNHISKILNDIKQAGMIFKKENEDRTNVKHIRQRRKFMVHVNELRAINTLTYFSFAKVSATNLVYYKERDLSFHK